MKKLLLLLGLVLLLGGCTILFRGQPVLGVDPNGNITYEHPEQPRTNQGPVISHQ